MALNKQVWLQTIQENFFPDDSFAVKSIDDSAFISNKTVHVPNAGSPSRVVINRSQKPASVTSRNDNDLSYDIDELRTVVSDDRLTLVVTQFHLVNLRNVDWVSGQLVDVVGKIIVVTRCH